jgi:hypothetical protein
MDEETVMARHKFKVGQVVDFAAPRLSLPTVGRYEIMRLLPSDGDQFQYRIKAVGESFERMAKEGQLSHPPSDNES